MTLCQALNSLQKGERKELAWTEIWNRCKYGVWALANRNPSKGNWAREDTVQTLKLSLLHVAHKIKYLNSDSEAYRHIMTYVEWEVFNLWGPVRRHIEGAVNNCCGVESLANETVDNLADSYTLIADFILHLKPLQRSIVSCLVEGCNGVEIQKKLKITYPAYKRQLNIIRKIAVEYLEVDIERISKCKRKLLP